MPGQTTGYVYIMRSKSLSHLKIGFTLRSIAEREAELYQTGMSEPLKAVYHVCVENPYEIEDAVHKELHVNRITQNREFFNCDTNYAIEVVRKICSQLNRQILIEWISQEISIGPPFAPFIGWSKNAQELIDKLTSDIDKKAKLLWPQWGRLLRNPPVTKNGMFEDLRMYKEWRKNFGEVHDLFFSISLERIHDAKQDIKYFSGMMPETRFNELHQKLASDIYKRTMDTLNAHEDFVKVMALSREYLTIENEIFAQLKREFEQDIRVCYIHDEFFKIQEMLLDAETFYAANLPALISSNRDYLKQWLIKFEALKYEVVKGKVEKEIEILGQKISKIDFSNNSAKTDNKSIGVINQKSTDDVGAIYNKYEYDEWSEDYDSSNEEELNFWFNKNIEDYVQIIFNKYFTKVRNRLKTLNSMSLSLDYCGVLHFVKFGASVEIKSESIKQA